MIELNDQLINVAIWGGVGFLSGSIPYGLLLTKAFCKVDVRTIGSGNIGATNVLRTGNKTIAALTLLLDGLKAYLPVYVAFKWQNGNDQLVAWLPYLVGLMCFLGHVFSPWLKFKGGKGIASAFGAYLAFNPLLGFVMLIAWAAIGKLFKISSLSALLSFAGATIWCVFFETENLKYWAVIVYGFIVWTHRDNIKRLLKGDESKMKFN